MEQGQKKQSIKYNPFEIELSNQKVNEIKELRVLNDMIFDLGMVGHFLEYDDDRSRIN